jgi:hypothetical protein
MALAMGDEFEVRCVERGATLRYRVEEQSIAIFLAAPTSPVNLTPINRQPGSRFKGCPSEGDDCAGVTQARTRLNEVPEYAEWRQQPEVVEWYERLRGRPEQ